MLRPTLVVSWAVVGGCVAAAPAWQPSSLFGLCVAWLLADGLLGYWLASLGSLGARSAASQLAATGPRWRLPYAQPGSRAWRMALTLTRSLVCLPAAGGGTVLGAASTVMLMAGVLLALGTYLGRLPLLAVSAALILGAGLWLLLPASRKAGSAPWALGLQLGCGWVLGCLVGGTPDAACASVGLLAGLILAVRRAAPDRWLARLAQGCAWAGLVLLMLLNRQPISAGMVAAAAAIHLSRQGLDAPGPTSAWAQELPLLASMAILALSLAVRG
jgi:hypothetical protein